MFRVWVSRFRVQGLGFRVEGLGLRTGFPISFAGRCVIEALNHTLKLGLRNFRENCVNLRVKDPSGLGLRFRV